MILAHPDLPAELPPLPKRIPGATLRQAEKPKVIYTLHLRPGTTKELLVDFLTACDVEVGIRGQLDVVWGEDTLRASARVANEWERICPNCLAMLVERDHDEAIKTAQAKRLFTAARAYQAMAPEITAAEVMEVHLTSEMTRSVNAEQVQVSMASSRAADSTMATRLQRASRHARR